uniref:Secreted protein n=1 Tax=Trichogramma kaykai TaxID=54128 RepID=A0ABD2VUT0_9HYME
MRQRRLVYSCSALATQRNLACTHRASQTTSRNQRKINAVSNERSAEKRKCHSCDFLRCVDLYMRAPPNWDEYKKEILRIAW